MIISVDADATASGMTATSGPQRKDVEQLVRSFDPAATVNADGEIELDGGATKVSLVRWEATDPPAQGLPDAQTLERLVSAAKPRPIRAAARQSRPGLMGDLVRL